MLRTFAAAAIAASLIAGPALAQGTSQGTAPTASAPMTTSQPVKADAKKITAVKHVTKAKMHTAKAVKHVKHVKHAQHVKHIKQVKRVKHHLENTRG